LGVPAADHEVVGVAHHPAQVQQAHVHRLLVGRDLRDPLRQPQRSVLRGGRHQEAATGVDAAYKLCAPMYSATLSATRYLTGLPSRARRRTIDDDTSTRGMSKNTSPSAPRSPDSVTPIAGRGQPVRST